MSSVTSPYTNSGAIPYPSPYFDIASTYLPKTFKEMMRWFKYYSVMDDIAASTIERLASFPVTRIIFECKDKKQRDIYEDVFLNQIGLKSRAREVGLDYFTFGNVFISIQYPFTRWLVCTIKGCGKAEQIQRADWAWKRMHFVGHCRKCGAKDVRFEIRDVYKPQRAGIRIRRWDPEQIEVRAADECVGEQYFYEISRQTRDAVERGDRYMLERCPKSFLDAIRIGGVVRLDPAKVFHFRRAARSDSNNPGLGLGILAGVLKKLFYKQVLLKAQEVLAKQHIVPLWILYPAGNNNTDVFQDMNASQWRSRLERDLNRWVRDPNHKVISPIQIGLEQLGGTQAEAGLHQQLESVNKDILAGMGVPMEFVMGGLSWSGASVTVRLLENFFISYQDDMVRLMQHFIIDNICDFLRLPRVRIRMQNLRMADDVQMKTALFQMNQANIVSRHSLLETFDIDYDEDKKWRDKEFKDLTKEAIEQALATARAQAVSTEAMQKAQIRMELRLRKMQMEVEQELAEEAGMDPEAVEVAKQEVEARGGPQRLSVTGQPQDGGGAPGGSDAGVAPGVGVAPIQDPQYVQAALVKVILGMHGDQRQQTLDRMSVEAPDLFAAVQQQMGRQGAGGGKSGKKPGGSTSKSTPKPGQMDMRPQPKQKPPRRQTASV